MRLLLCLAEHAPDVVSIDDLLNQVWAGVIVSPDSVYQAVASLRRLLGDDAKQPDYIATVQRLGYRMVAPVSPWTDEPLGLSDGALSSTGVVVPDAAATREPRESPQPLFQPPQPPPPSPLPQPQSPSQHLPPPKRFRVAVFAASAVLCLGLVALIALRGPIAGNQGASATTGVPEKSVAVLPFLDLTTQEMNEEYFADGMTEELIDKLSKVPGLRVPPPTSSFYFKGKKLTVTDIAKSLGVVYLLDGSVRKSDSTLRVAARLIRADDGYVVWSETYDRPVGDKLMIQDDIAGEVTKALKASIR
jgi:TolB-like protein/DNA-binding winged helix-turn-helix (wHTH) protein